MRKTAPISLLALLLLVALLPERSSATNMRVGPILTPTSVIQLNHPLIIAFLLRNDSLYDAEQIRSIFTIRDVVTNEIVFEHETMTPFMAAYTAFTVYSQLAWIPEYAGRFRLSVDIVYNQDVIPGDNSRTMEFRVEAPPAGIFEAYRYNMMRPFVQMYSLYGEFFLHVAARNQLKWVNVVGWKHDTEAVWLAQNLPLPPDDDSLGYSTWIDWGKMGLQNGVVQDSVTLSVTVTDTTWSAVTTELLKQGFILKPDTFAVGPGAQPHSNPDPPIAFPSPQNYPTGPILRESILRHRMPNIDLDSSRFNPGTVAGYAGDLNACVPASGANSMHWLEREEEALPNTVTHQEKLRLMSAFCQRSNEDGVYDTSFVKGKLHFADSLKLPISVKWQSHYTPVSSMAGLPSPISRFGHSANNQTAGGDNPKVTMDWIVQEVKDHEDVELFYAWQDSTGNLVGSHAVTISGVITDNDRLKGIWIVDDGKQTVAGGTRQRYFDIDEGVDPRGPVLRNFWAGRCFIHGAFSESYDSSVKFIEEPKSVGRTHAPLPTLHTSVIDGILLVASLPERSGRVTLNLIDVSGRTLHEFTLENGRLLVEYDLRLLGLVHGTYLLSLQQGNSVLATGTFQY